MIYTSYHGNLKKLLSKGIQPINISRYRAKWFPEDYPDYFPLAPSGDMLKLSEEYYTPKFMKILAELDPSEVINDLHEKGEKRGSNHVAICCFEKPGEFCHRHLVAEWLNIYLGQGSVKEFTTNSRSTQMSMF